MRVLLATDYYPPPLVGGRDLHVQLLAHRLADRGHDVHVVSLAGQSGPSQEDEGPVVIHRVVGLAHYLSRYYSDKSKPFHPTLPDPGVVAHLRSLVDAIRPDVLHCHSWLVYSALFAFRRLDLPIVMTMHEYGLVCSKNTLMYGGDLCSGPMALKCIQCAATQYGLAKAAAIVGGLRASRSLHKRVTIFLAVSKPVADAFQLVSAGTPVTIVPPFLEDDAFTSANRPPRPSFAPDEPYIMYAGALSHHKGVDVLLNAYTSLRGPRPPLLLLGLATTDQLPPLPQDALVVKGVPHSDVLAAWAHALLGVVPSRWPDPSPFAALEALAAGTPLIASAIGGLPYIVDDMETGLLALPGDAEALAEKIALLLADADLRHRLGVSGAERSRRYSWTEIVPRIEAIYQMAIDVSAHAL